jgi:hypothetical protein
LTISLAAICWYEQPDDVPELFSSEQLLHPIKELPAIVNVHAAQRMNDFLASVSLPLKHEYIQT